MKINKKVLGLIVAGVVVLGFGCDSEETTQEVQESSVIENQVEKEIEAEKEEAKKEEAEEKHEDAMTQAEMAAEFLRPTIEESYEGLEYKLEVTNDNLVTLRLNIPAEEVIYAVNTEEWEVFVETARLTSDKGKEFLENLGNNSSFAILVGDFELDRYYLSTVDGIITYDVQNDL